MELFLILTPFLLLVIVGLLGFVGCVSFAGTDPTSNALSITTPSALPDATVGVSYTPTMAAKGGSGAYQWSVTGGGLPAGLTLHPGGNIDGTPTGAVQQYSATIQVMDNPVSPGPGKPVPLQQTAQGMFTLNLLANPNAPKVAAINPSSGPDGGGTPITVGGSNFVAGAQLALGGIAAKGVTVVSSTTIHATTGGPGAGSVNVVVTNPDGESGSLTNGFTYVAAAVAHSGVTDVATASGVTATALQSGVILLTGPGSKLLVVTVIWGGAGTITGGVPTFVSGGGGATFQPVAAAAPWSALKVQTFFANGVQPGSIQVKVQFSATLPSDSKLCTSAYDNAAAGNPTYGVVVTPDGKVGTSLQSAGPINASAQDLVYAVGLAATSAGMFPGGITVTPGTGFTAEPGPGNPLVEDRQIAAAGSVTVTATNSTGGASSRWFMFAMGIKHL